MATTALAAIKEVHETNAVVNQYISQGVWYSVAPENLDISAGGVMVIQLKGYTRDKTTESVQETTRVDLMFFHNDFATLDQLITPWVLAAFDDQEEGTSVLSIDGATTISTDVAEDEPITGGVEAAKDKLGNNVFSMTFPLKIWVERPRQSVYANS